MADFFQNGLITTLQILGNRDINEIERDLLQCSTERKMVLLLPALYTEFQKPAMKKIIEQLMYVKYLDKIVLSLDRANEGWFHKAKKMLSPIPCNTKIVWHDGPRLKKMQEELEDKGFWLDYPGKGRSVWLTLGYILSDSNTYAIGLHDCDIINYNRSLIARLFFPVVHPALDYEFSKGYYSRVTNKLYGRVTRLFYTPLIRSLKKILGYTPFLEYLDSFRFALAGEFAFMASLSRGIRISPTWGLEVSMLSEVYSKTSINKVAQVELMESYEHKHQDIRKGLRDRGLLRMAGDIAKTMLRVLTQDGIVLSDAFFRTLLTTYMQESRFAIEKYHGLSMINGLSYDRHEEIEAVELFVDVLKESIGKFISDPVEIPMLAAWTRIDAAIPDFADRLNDAVEMDNK